MCSVLLACDRFEGRHTAENILRQYLETIKTFGISSKVSIVVTDNASNMRKAFALPGFENYVSEGF